MPWFIGSDQLLEVTGLRDPVTGSYVNGATISVTMYESDGISEVSGQSWPLTLSYVSGSDGDYNGVLQDDRVLVDGRLYWIGISVDAGGDLIKKWRWQDVARYRTPDDD